MANFRPLPPKAKVDDFVNLVPIQNVVVVASPFSQSDWDTVSRPQPKIVVELARPPLSLLAPNPSSPFIQDLWESAAFPRIKAIGEAIGVLSPLLTPNPAQPFILSDWGLPTLARQKITDTSVAVLLPLYLPGRPFVNSTESRVFALQSVRSDIFVNVLPLQPVVVTSPFIQSDWTNAASKALKLSVEHPFNFLPLITPVVPPPAPDTHDGVWSEDLYRKYQEQIERKRKQLLRQEKYDTERKLKLRKQLEELFYELPVEEQQTIVSEPSVIETVEKNIDYISSLETLTAQHAKLLAAYKEILDRETMRYIMDEEDIELLLVSEL